MDVPPPGVRADAISFSVWGLGAALLSAFGLLHSSEPELTLNCAGRCSCEHFPSLNSLLPCFIFLCVLLQTLLAKRIRQKKTSRSTQHGDQPRSAENLFSCDTVQLCSFTLLAPKCVCRWIPWWATSLAKGDSGAGRGLMGCWARTRIGGNVAAVWSGFGVELLLFHFFFFLLQFFGGSSVHVWSRWLRKPCVCPWIDLTGGSWYLNSVTVRRYACLPLKWLSCCLSFKAKGAFCGLLLGFSCLRVFSPVE